MSNGFELGIGPVSIGYGGDDPPTLHPREQRALFRSDRKHQEDREDSYFKRLIRNASNAGIHPLAALGAQTVGPVVANWSPTPDYGSSGGGSRSSFGYSAPSEVDEAQAKLLNKQADLVDQQIIDSELARAKSLVTPQNVHDALKDHDIKKPTHTPSYVLPGGVRIKRHPSSDMETLTNLLGEPAEWALFMPQIVNDLIYTIRSYTQSDKTKERIDKTGEKNTWRYRWLKSPGEE